MDFLLLISGRFRSGLADGMGKICGTKRLQLKIGKLKMLALIKFKGIMCTVAEKQQTRGQLPFSNIAMPNLRGFFLGNFMSERMRFSITLGSSSSSEYRMPSFAPVYSCIRRSRCWKG
jgi:hypothetical protein